MTGAPLSLDELYARWPEEVTTAIVMIERGTILLFEELTDLLADVKERLPQNPALSSATLPPYGYALLGCLGEAVSEVSDRLSAVSRIATDHQPAAPASRAATRGGR
jgi:hypothetical protein